MGFFSLEDDIIVFSPLPSSRTPKGPPPKKIIDGAGHFGEMIENRVSAAIVKDMASPFGELRI